MIVPKSVRSTDAARVAVVPLVRRERNRSVTHRVIEVLPL